MQMQRQFTTFLENKPGRLSDVCSALAKQKVNIQALAVMDSNHHSALRFVVQDPSVARGVLDKLNTEYTETDVVVVELKNQPGALANLCDRLAADHVNIDYVYCSASGKGGKALAILKATPLDRVKAAVDEPARTRTRLPTKRAPVRKT